MRPPSGVAQGVLADMAAEPTMDVAATAPSFAQERLWIIDQLVEDKALYNASMLFHLQGPLDASLLERSIIEVMRRHAMLRSGFVGEDGKVVIVEVAAPAFSLAIEDAALSGRSTEWMAQHQRDVTNRPFDLAFPPLLRATLYRLGEDAHELLLTVHHIIFDGASIDLFAKEIESIYPSLSVGRAHPLPDLAMQAAHAAARERERLHGEHRQRLLDYWQRHLGNDLPVLALPSDSPRPSVQSYRGATLSIPLSAAWMERLDTACRRERATPFMVVLAAYAVWLCRYANQKEVVIGSPFALRSDKHIQPLMGFFVNTVAMRIGLDERSTFPDFLRKVRSQSLDAYAHGELPFGELVGALGAQRELAHSPVFQAMLVVQNPRISVQLTPQLRMRYAGEVPTDRARFDVALVLDPLEDGATLSLEYNGDLFDAPTAQRMLDHFKVFLSAALEHPQMDVGQLPLLDQVERQRAIELWNDTGRNAPAGFAHALFEENAQRMPDAPALIFGSERWTYGALERRANQLAHVLRERGVRPEVPVSVLMERSPELVCTMLAIFKAGGVYLPLDPALPDERLTFMLDDARPGVIVTGLASKARMETLFSKHPSPANPSLWDWQNDRASLDAQPEATPEHGPAPDNLAYVIYTSGSTGKPKGVEVTHRAFFNLVRAKMEGFGVFPDSCVLQFVSFGFDVSVSDVCMTLAAGARLLLRPADVMGGEPLARLLRTHEVSVIVLPASVLATVPPTGLPALKSVIAGGEACSAELVDRWVEGRRFINAYGPTEATICTTMARCAMHGGPPPIGHPIAHAQTYVLDANLEPVPVGVTGELYIGGAGLARGYLGRPALTAEHFIPHPFATTRGAVPPGSRLYRTGDLARYLPDGAIAFVERVDNQVKIRGFRIELGEIEAVLQQHPQVQDAVVTAQTFGAGGKQLVAYCVPRDGAALDGAELASHLRSRLPEHMVPAAILLLEGFPRTANGKVDRRALPSPETLGHQARREYVAPRTLTEEILADIVSDVLTCELVSVEDDFFALGGQSILAAQVISRASDRFELPLSVRLLFESPTVTMLALRVEDALMAQIAAMDDDEVAQALIRDGDSASPALISTKGIVE